MGPRSRLALPLLALAIVLTTSGFLFGGGDKPIRIKGEITVSGDVNPGPDGAPSPVVLRIYQLRSAGVFQSADFFAIYDDEQATLGQGLIAREELNLPPGATQEYEREFDKETKFIGVLAAFRDIEEASWRSVLEVPRKKKKLKLRIEVGKDTVSVTRK